MIFVLFYILQVCLGDVTMELGQTYDGAITPWQNDSKYKLYSLQIKEVIPDRDLILVVKQLSAIGNPDIYISTKTREPNQFTNDIKCESVGLDICVINKVEVTTYHIAVHCEDFCRFQLKAVYEAELQMSNSDDLEFKFNNEEWTEVVRINVQEFEQLLYSDSQTLEVQVRIKNIEIMEERFVSYLNIGDQIPNPEKYDYIGEDTFSGMQKFKIKNINLQQKFTLLIEGQQGAIVAIQTRTYGGIHQMYLGEKIEDIVQDGQFQFYCINLTQDVESLQKGNTILNIQLLPYKGYTQMYVNLDYQPSFIDGYYWQLNDTITDDLVITSEDLIKAKAKGGLAFVAVRAIDSNATYELRSSLFDPNFMVLEWNKPATAKLNKNSQIQYKFYIRANKKETVSVSLKNIYGDADIIVKQCSALWQCKIDNDEIKNRVMKTNNEPGKLFLFSELPGNDIIVFDNNPDKCHQIDNTFQCYYVVLIYPGPKNEVDELTYSILVTAKGEQTLLRENTPMKQFVNHELYNYYKFVIEENDQIRRLMIQITPIQGQPKLYVSQTEQRPTKEKYDQQGVQNLVSYGGRQNHEPIKGTFYIGVYGYTASQYIITTNVIRGRGDWRQYGKFSNQYQLLLDGYPHESNTNNQTEIQLYKIDLSAYYNPDYIEHQQVEIYLRIIQGEFMMYAFDHPEVDINKAFLTGKNELILSHSSKIYPQYLYIRIEPNQQLNLSTYSYQIYYRIDQQPIELVIGNNFDGYIQKENTQTFFFNYYKDEDLIISKHVENHDQSIVTATVYFGQETMTLQGQSLTLHKEQLQFDKCKTNATEIVKCQISIFVISKENTYYQLLITKDQSIVKLFDGEPVTKPIRNQTDYYTFLLSNIETEISVFSISGEIRILANITKNGYPTLDQFPKSDKDSLLQSLNDQYEIGSSIFISPDLYDEYQCFQDNCYVTITCMSINTRTSSLGDYTITRTSSVIPLSEGFLYQSEIKEQRIKYFKVQSIPAGQGLMIIATPLSQGSLIIVASENEMPTIDTHQYSSNSMFGDQLIIEPNKEDIDTIYIGVYSFEKVKFSIQINIGTTHFYQIRRGQPFNFFQQYNSTYYLNYFHAIDSEFMILISHNQISQYGRPNISVTTYKDMTDQAKTLVTENYKWNMMDQYLIINKQQDYCTNCYYLIRIQNFNSDTDFTATISAKNESIHLLDNLEQSNLLQINDIHYYHYSSENNDFYINTTLIKGKISIYGGFFNQKDEIDKLLFYLDENEGLLDKNGEIVKGRQGLLVNGTKFINQTDRNNKENNGPLYRIKVQSTVQSVYKIECISTQQAIELRLGEPQRQYLNGQSISVFYFYIPTTPFFSRKNPFYSITIETYGQSQKKIREKDQFPQIQLLKDEFNNPDYNSEYHNFTNVLINLNNQTNLLMYFEISNEAGVYFLKIKPREYSTLPYIVTLGNDDLNVLPSQLQRFVNSKPGQSRFWEVTINKPQKLLIQAQLCNGKISVFENEDLNELKQGIYKQKLEYRHNRQVVGTFDANKNGTYYISTQALKGKYDLVSYILSLNILEPNSIIVDEHFEPGEGGDLTLNYNKPNISVQFKSVRIAELSSQDYKLLGISYFLIHKYQEINDDQPIALCDETILFPSFHIKAAKHKSDQYLSFNNAIDTNFEKVLVTVMARVKTITNNHEYINYDYFYNTETIKQDNLILYQKTHEFKKGILAIILTILLIIIVYLLMRNRRLKQSLKYEQSEQTLQKLRSEQAIEMNYTNLR